MRKLTCVLLTLLLALAPLSAVWAVEAAPEELLSSYTPQDGKPYELSITCWTAGPVDNENAPVLKYVEEQTGVRFVFDNIDGTSYNDLINVRLASGDAPDVFSVAPRSSFVKFYNQGIARSFDERVLAQLAPKFYELVMSECPASIALSKLDAADPNAMMAIAQYKFHAQYVFPNVWRKDWLENVGITSVPDNLNDFEKAIYAFTNDDPDQNGEKDTYGISQSGLNALYAAYGYLPTAWSQLPDGSLGFGAVQPAMKEALAQAAKWYADGVIDPEFITGENLGGRGDLCQAFHTDRIGYTGHADYWTWCQLEPYGLNYQEFSKTHQNPDQALAIVEPMLAVDGTSRNSTYRAAVIQHSYMMLNSEMTDDEVGALMRFLDWGYGSLENYRTLWYGFEGEHWYFDESGMSQPKGEYANDKGLQNAIGAYTTLGAFIEPFYYQGAVRGNLGAWADGLGLNDGAFEKFGIVDQLLVVPDSYNMYWTELEKIREDAYISIITGQQPVDSFDEFVANWMKNGGEIITQDANAWWTEYNA